MPSLFWKKLTWTSAVKLSVLKLPGQSVVTEVICMLKKKKYCTSFPKVTVSNFTRKKNIISGTIYVLPTQQLMNNRGIYLIWCLSLPSPLCSLCCVPKLGKKKKNWQERKKKSKSWVLIDITLWRWFLSFEKWVILATNTCWQKINHQTWLMAKWCE